MCVWKHIASVCVKKERWMQFWSRFDIAKRLHSCEQIWSISRMIVDSVSERFEDLLLWLRRKFLIRHFLSRQFIAKLWIIWGISD
jgi:hypothetical protein